VVGSARRAGKFTLSPTGSSLPPPGSIKELPGKKDCHQAPIRNISEPYSSSGLLHTRVEFGHNCQAIHRACSFLATNTRATKVREPLQCSCRTQKSPRLSRVLVLVVVLGLGIEAFCQDEEGSMEKASGGGFARATRKTDEDVIVSTLLVQLLLCRSDVPHRNQADLISTPCEYAKP
jgi:hypothetical protein